MHWGIARPLTALWPQMKTVAADFSSGEERLTLLWSAGTAGFDALASKTRLEMAIFQDGLDLARFAVRMLRPAKFEFHLISSAGGLFEGQRTVGKRSVPSPVRPYGEMKLSQERLLRAEFDSRQAVVYRPSSVYGPMRQKKHQGLINNLISDALAGRESVLESRVMALRDYVCAFDIGDFIGKRIRSGIGPDTPGQADFLVSAKCSSIFEVVHKIERVLHTKLRYRFDPGFGNSRNITFSDELLPPGWRPAALDVGIRRFMVGAARPPRTFRAHPVKLSVVHS